VRLAALGGRITYASRFPVPVGYHRHNRPAVGCLPFRSNTETCYRTARTPAAQPLALFFFFQFFQKASCNPFKGMV